MLYVVQRRNWTRHGTSPEATPHRERLVRLPGCVRLSSFADEADALAECTRLEEQARRAVNPFTCDGDALHYQTSFDADRLHDWLLDADIQPPPRERREWAIWWEEVHDTLTEMQWRHVWRALDKLVFHEVVARPRRPVVYVVAEVGWRYNDSGYDPRPEGGVPVKAYRSRERAEAERLRRETEARRDYVYLDGFDLVRRQRRAEPFSTATYLERPNVDDPHYPLFFEIIEVAVDA